MNDQEVEAIRAWIEDIQAEVLTMNGSELSDRLYEIAGLRIELFREWRRRRLL